TLYFSELSSGSWTTAAPLPSYSATPALGEVGINSGCSGGGDDNGFVVGDLSGNVTLYWESHRGADDGSACGGARHLYQSTFEPLTNSWTDIQAVPGINATPDLAVDSPPDDSQISLTPDKATAYWTSVRSYNSALTYGIFTATWDAVNSTYANVH